MISSQLTTPDEVQQVLFHESLGHFGLRSVFGDALTSILQQISTMRKAAVDAKMAEYGLNGIEGMDRLTAAEEVLAVMAQTDPQIGFVKRAVAAIRTWLRENVPGFKNMAMSDDEIIRNYLTPARDFVRRGAQADRAASSVTAPALSRDAGEQVDTAAFKAWYGNWQNTENGKPNTPGHADGIAGQPAGRAANDTGRAEAVHRVQRSGNVDTNHRGPIQVGAVSFPGTSGPVGKDSRPVRFYHGTRDDVDAFKVDHANRLDKGWLGRGVYATNSSDLADGHAEFVKRPGNAGPNTMPLFMAVHNPFVATNALKLRLKNASQEYIDRFTQDLKAKGHDGVAMAFDDGYIELMAFDSTNVKSAIGNNGNFDGSNADIRFSRSQAATLTSSVTDRLNETFTHPGTLSWWHKTVGSMYDLSERSAPFKRVFVSAQGFINDVSYYGTEAADMAPKILPKLEDFKDITKSPISFTDNRAISAPIFQGTLNWTRNEAGKPVLVDDLKKSAESLSADQKGQRLLRAGKISENVLKMWQAMPIDQYEKAVTGSFERQLLKPGIVWSDAELQNQFKLNAGQIGLYREFHASVGRSLDNAAKAKMLSIGGEDVADLKAMVMDAPDADAAGLLLRDHLMALAKEQPDRSEGLIASASLMMDQADTINDLKAAGYAPLSRFGRYSVDVVAKGERQYFGLFETMRDANRMAATMKAEYGAENVAQGTLSQREFELFQGITPDSLELFGNMLGLDTAGNEAKDQAFQQYIAMTKNNNSAMKRLMHRKGVAGYSEDVGRVLASFVYSNARQTSAALNLGELGQAITAIPKSQGEVKDVAIKLADYVKNPQEEAQAMRGLLFAQYLGGSIASAFVNLTQPMAVSFPYLSQFGGARQSAGALIKAVKDMANKSTVYEPGLASALHIAEEQGIVSPQEVHQLMAQARGKSTLHGGDGTRTGEVLAYGKNAVAKMALGWGKLFGIAEQINRRSTFIAAYRIAVAQKIADPSAFAVKAVNETQFINNRGNKMQWGRGAVGATLMTFKSYGFNYLELLHRMATRNGPEGKKAAALMLGMLVLMAGAGGLPFEDDLEDLIDFFAQRMGYNFSSKQAKQSFLEDLFGKAGANFVDRGITGLPGSPIDISGRMSMANLIPATGLLLQKRDHAGDLQDLIGPMGDMVSRMFKAGDQAINGDFARAALSLAPKAVSNLAQGIDMADKGMYRDQKGYKVLETTPFESAMKAVGFQPASVSQIQESNFQHQKAKDFYNLHAQDIRARWAKGLFEKDPEQVAGAKAMLEDWNEKNPDQRILPNLSAILKKAHEMAKTKDQRINDTAPSAMREKFRRESAEDRAALQ